MTESGGESPFWKYEDLLLFLGAVLPAGALGALLVRISGVKDSSVKTLLFQAASYALLLGVLYLLVAVRYGRPFWRSLGWSRAVPRGWLCLAASPLLAIATSTLGVALRAPEVGNPVENLISGRASLVVVMAFVVLFGPIFEELLFRGFLLPLLARTFGAAGGIVLSALPFALLHGGQNQWAWQQVTLVGFAGLAFGFARHKTGSTVAATALHAGYNLTLFAGYLLQRVAQT